MGTAPLVLNLAALALQSAGVVVALTLSARSTAAWFWRLLAAALAVGAIRRLLSVAVSMHPFELPELAEASVNVAGSMLVLAALWPVLRDRLKLDRINDDVNLPREASKLRTVCGDRLSVAMARLVIAARRLGKAKHGRP